MHQNHVEGLLRHRLLSPPSQSSGFNSSCVSLRICILISDADGQVMLMVQSLRTNGLVDEY